MKTFRKSHKGLKVERDEDVVNYEPDTVYIVFPSPEDKKIIEIVPE